MKNDLLYIGITGHRQFKTTEIKDFVKAAIEKRIDAIQQDFEQVHALSALAIGADTLFAEIALDLGCALEVIVPFDKFDEDFSTDHDKQRYRNLLGSAVAVHKLKYRNRSNTAYLAGGRWIVNNASLLIAVWDGKSGKGKGGTSDVVAYAEKKKKNYWHINTSELTVKEVSWHG